MKLVPADHPFLHRPPAKYLFEGDEGAAKEIADELFEAMKSIGGIGLSANQVGLDSRIFVIGYDEVRLYVFNPEVIWESEEKEYFDEGCLSYPGLKLNIKRSKDIKVRYQDETGNWQEKEFTGLTARVFLHEYDHMVGTNFTKRVTPLKLDFAKKRLANQKKKLIKKYAEKVIYGIKHPQ